MKDNLLCKAIPNGSFGYACNICLLTNQPTNQDEQFESTDQT